MATNAPAAPERHLGVFDAIAIVVGIVIGSFIFFLGPFLVARNATSPTVMMLAWVMGGVLCLCGALSYAELTTTYPKVGGEYFYLTRAFGSAVGFLFVWARSTVIQTGSIALLAYVFGKNLTRLIYGDIPQGSLSPMFFALVATAVLTAINVAGWRMGKWTQNTLTVSKVIGVLAIIVIGATLAPAAGPGDANAPMGTDIPWFGYAMVFVLLTFGGWSEAAYVAGEVRDAKRNMVKVMVGSILVITALYLVANLVYLRALGFHGLRSNPAIAAQTVANGVGKWGGDAITILIALSALGAVNGCMFTGARAIYAMGTDFKAFRFLGCWNARLGTPARATILQSLIAMVLIVIPNLGKGFQKAFGPDVQSLVDYTAPVFWIFVLLTGVGVFVLRAKDRDIERPYRVPLYPIPVVLFILMCGFMVYSSVAYTKLFALVGVGVLALGVPLALVLGRRAPEPNSGTGN